jgi:hypothetical protein
MNEKKVLKYSALAFVAALITYTLTRKAMDIIINENQKKHLESLHQRVKPIFERFIKELKKRGFDVYITSSYRTFEKQAELKKLNSKNASPGLSPHNYGMAIDINVRDGLTWLRKASSKEDWEKSGIPEIARSMGIRWGGDFRTYYDPIHFDVLVMPTKELQKIAQKQFGTDVRKVQGNRIIV